MKRLLGTIIGVCLIANGAQGYWQSRSQDSVSSTSYTGPGDIVSGAFFWIGLRAYSLATAGTKSDNICNAADANCADVNTLANGNFDVATAQGAPLNCGWAGGTCTVKILYDKSGNTNCNSLACDFTQATIALRPTLTFSCTGAGKACATFNGSSQFMQSSGTVASISVVYTYATYAKQTGGAGTAGLMGETVTGNMGFGTDAAVNNQIFQLSSSVAVFASQTSGSFHFMQAQYGKTGTANSSAMTVDGVITNSSTSFAGGAGNALTLAADPGQGNFQGTLTEFGLWLATFSDPNKVLISTNATNYY